MKTVTLEVAVFVYQHILPLFKGQHVIIQVMEIHLYNNWTQETQDTRGFVFLGLSYHEDYYTGYTEFSLCISLIGLQLVFLTRKYYI